MSTIEGRYFFAAEMIYSGLLSDFLASVADRAVASMDCDGGRQVYTSEPSWGIAENACSRLGPMTEGSLNVTEVELGASDLSTLLEFSADSAHPGRWQAFCCRFSNGTKDILALHDVSNTGEAMALLKAVWPALRRTCSDAGSHRGSDLSDDAMLWVINQKVNAAILAIDEHSRVLKANAAAEEILSEGRLLRIGPAGLVCANRQATQALRAAVRESFESGNTGQHEFVLLLRSRSGTAHIPVSLSTYVQVETGQKLILLMLPRPPNLERIEGLARRMGLTPSEARVAALIREGHSNKKAAEIAGLKTETFNTYAKRAMSKMNVKCRSEMAQMLTWQATLERPL